MPGGGDIRCRAILFDCDGVLVDSKVLGNRAWSRWAGKYGLDPAAVLEGVHGRRSTETVALFLPEARRAAGVTAIDALELDDAPDTPAMPGALALLPTLPDDSWAVVTSAALPLLRARMSAAGLALPMAVVTSEDVSAGKPSPHGYLLAAQRLGVPIADCVVIEDSVPGIRAGRAAGAGHVLGIGPDAVGSDVDSIVLDLRACTWTGAGLHVDDSYADDAYALGPAAASDRSTGQR